MEQTPAVHGYCDPRLRALGELLEHNLSDGSDLGASVCVVRDGEVVVDLFGGVADATSGAAWQADTVTNVWSVTKTVAALVVLRLVACGDLALDKPVCTYWTEFGAAGKGAVTLRHILGHTSGVCAWADRLELAQFLDAPAAAARLADQKPWWTPGDGSGYHALTQGHLLGEVVTRVAGVTVGRALAEEITGPLGADFWIGMPASEHHRVAPMVAPPHQPKGTPQVAVSEFYIPTMLNPRYRPSATVTPEWLSAELPAVNGQGNARSVALLNSVLSHDGCAPGGRRILPSSLVGEVYRPVATGVDRVLGLPLSFGLGIGLGYDETPFWLPSGPISWWPGFGGAIVVNDPRRRLTMAYVPNKMTAQPVGAPRTHDYVRAVWAS